jgi:hypothetical protein
VKKDAGDRRENARDSTAVVSWVNVDLKMDASERRTVEVDVELGERLEVRPGQSSSQSRDEPVVNPCNA